jgi:hypothetical protein
MEERLVAEEEWQALRRRRLGQVYALLLGLEESAPDAMEAGQPGASGAADVALERVVTAAGS